MFTSHVLHVLAAGLLGGGFTISAAWADDPQLTRGRLGIEARTGCYLVDYSYTETEGLQPGYVRDTRVYDVNRTRSYKEWIIAEPISPTRIHLQHILFGVELNGKVMDETMLKHTGEDWEYNAPFLYDFTGPGNWSVKDLTHTPGLWTRRITNLDDGLRYQCAAAWDLNVANPDWTCDDYAPIPGRETRDMGRKDYNTLQRSTRIISYGPSWIEREANIKTVDTKGVRTPLAKEVGKNWYVRLPDVECSEAQAFAKPRLPFWLLLRETWDEVLKGDRPFIDKNVAGKSRYFDISDIEDRSLTQDLAQAKVRQAVKDEILKTIGNYRAP